MKLFLSILAVFFNIVHTDWIDFFDSKEKLEYIYPADFTCISEVQFKDKYIFKLNKESDLLAIHDGKISIHQEKKQIILTEKNNNKKIKIVYENIYDISVNNNDLIKKGDVIGKADKYIYITIKENGVVVDSILSKI